MKRVMIALDYNNSAQKVAETGFEFAKAMNAETCLVHAIPDISYYTMEYSPVSGFEDFSPGDSFKNLAEQEHEARLFLNSVVKHLGDNSIKTKVIKGAYYESLLEYASEYGADMIVMGSQGHYGIEKLIMGDVVSKVVQHTNTQILIVPADRKDFQKFGRQSEVNQYI